MQSSNLKSLQIQAPGLNSGLMTQQQAAIIQAAAAAGGPAGQLAAAGLPLLPLNTGAVISAPPVTSDTGLPTVTDTISPLHHSFQVQIGRILGRSSYN